MAKKNLRRGVFITFEGVEGCGKSTHSKAVFNYLKREGFRCLYTKEPGGTRVGKKIRNILLDPANRQINAVTELFLFEASRSQIVTEVIRPALKKGMIVICDRFFDATTAYQGYAGRLGRRLVNGLNRLAAGGLKPDLTIIMDINVREGLKRAGRIKKDRMERKALSYHYCVKRGYRDIAKKDPGRVRLITTKDDRGETRDLVKNEVLNAIRRYKAAR